MISKIFNYSRFVIGAMLLLSSVFTIFTLEIFGYGIPWVATKWDLEPLIKIASAEKVPDNAVPPEPQIQVGNPATLNITETKPILLIFDWLGPTKITSPVKARLESPAFDIVPKDFQEQSFSHPTIYTWIVTPKKEGKHILRLDIDYDALWPPTINNQTHQTSLKQNWVKLIHVNVLTILGISPRTYEIVRIVVGFLSFLLLYPILIDGIKLWWKKRKHRAKQEQNSEHKSSEKINENIT